MPLRYRLARDGSLPAAGELWRTVQISLSAPVAFGPHDEPNSQAIAAIAPGSAKLDSTFVNTIEVNPSAATSAPTA